MKDEDLTRLLASLPTSPGVYLMKDHEGRIVYVGKAKNLRARVRQYFAPKTTDYRHFVKDLKRTISDIEVVLTSSEKEALLLEYTLVQRHTPRFNIRLMDDKSFLCLRLDPKERWPSLTLVRRPKKDGALYFGPFDSAFFARETLRLINRHFKLRSCSDKMFANRGRPCLQHQIKRCFGPCVLEVDEDEYAKQVSFVKLFLDGRKDDLISLLEGRMARFAAEMEYELAAAARDQIAAVKRTLAPQRVIDFKDRDQDILGFARAEEKIQISVLEVRAGRLNAKSDYFFDGKEFSDEHILTSFAMERYSRGSVCPDEVLVPVDLDDREALEEILSESKGKRVRVINPKRGPRVDQMRMADLNAAQALKARMKSERDTDAQLEAVRRKLKLPRRPSRIECVDIAHLGGTDTVAAIGVVRDGQVSRKDGRRYKIRGDLQGDDYGAMKQVLERRFERALRGDEGWAPPDLLVVDGGRGQLAIALEVFKELGVDDQPVVALAKIREKEGEAASDRIFLPGRMNPIPIRGEASSLFLLARARDEAHRLANRFQGKTRRTKRLSSELSGIPGVGEKTTKLLLKALGSLKKVAEAREEELASVKGIGPKTASLVADYFRNKRER